MCGAGWGPGSPLAITLCPCLYFVIRLGQQTKSVSDHLFCLHVCMSCKGAKINCFKKVSDEKQRLWFIPKPNHAEKYIYIYIYIALGHSVLFLLLYISVSSDYTICLCTTSVFATIDQNSHHSAITAKRWTMSSSSLALLSSFCFILSLFGLTVEIMKAKL
jgi:hypothetical protein